MENQWHLQVAGGKPGNWCLRPILLSGHSRDETGDRRTWYRVRTEKGEESMRITYPHRIHGAAIYGNIYHQYTPNVSIYIIHGSYGIHNLCMFMYIWIPSTEHLLAIKPGSVANMILHQAVSQSRSSIPSTVSDLQTVA